MLTALIGITYLAVLEGLLSCDNALALAALVKRRLTDEPSQKKALRYGIVGAYTLRFAAIMGGTWVLSHPLMRWIAALYLIYMCINALFLSHDSTEEPEDGPEIPWLHPLISTIIAVEFLDAMFSLDSIAVTLTVSNNKWVLMAGAAIGIAMMRFCAGLFIKLLNRFPFLEQTAFILVGQAGIKLVFELMGYQIPEILFFGSMFVIIALSFTLNRYLAETKNANF